MKNTSLMRSIPYWLLLVLSLVAVAVGGWLVVDNTATMQTTLLDGTATNIEVYVGQAWITAGAAVLAAGILGVLITLGIAAAKTLVPSSTPVVVEEIDWTAEDESSVDSAPERADSAPEPADSDPEPVEGSELEDQNGSSGSIATATKISVK
ncbi:hypothetical protein [Microbacterium sp.]|uniref:hypothetical protein n=1 Tax=Microbacterium sp. TaxID=51671 RepID=UPI003F9DE745